ncbi:MAG: DUF5602 domain-containing protein [Candidatus Elarobacter sp.]
MVRASYRAVAAASLMALLLAAPGLAKMHDMNEPPVPWPDTGAAPHVERDAQGNIASIALTIPAATVHAVPSNRAEAVFPMSDGGLVRSTNLQWHPSGHAPAHVYDVPHFDVHFYTIGEDVRHTIVPGAKAGSVRPAKGIMPPGVMLAPGFVPMMGEHGIPKDRPEFNGGKFTVSPIIGFWNGDVAFFEVMFTKTWLEKSPETSGAFPQPASVRRHGWYPTRYAVHFDKANDAYEVALTNFRSR